MRGFLAKLAMEFAAAAGRQLVDRGAAELRAMVDRKRADAIRQALLSIANAVTPYTTELARDAPPVVITALCVCGHRRAQHNGVEMCLEAECPCSGFEAA